MFDGIHGSNFQPIGTQRNDLHFNSKLTASERQAIADGLKGGANIIGNFDHALAAVLYDAKYDQSDLPGALYKLGQAYGGICDLEDPAIVDQLVGLVLSGGEASVVEKALNEVFAPATKMINNLLNQFVSKASGGEYTSYAYFMTHTTEQQQAALFENGVKNDPSVADQLPLTISGIASTITELADHVA